MMLALYVAVAGGAGALARYLIDAGVRRKTAGPTPWGTVVVNVSGSLVLGFLTGLSWFHGVGGHVEAVLGTGLCGGYTTWSTASWETVRLLETGFIRTAGLQAVGGLAVALAAAGIGMALAAL